MDPQYHILYQSSPVSGDKYPSQNIEMYPTGYDGNGGHHMDRLSNASSTSFSSNNCFPIPEDPEIMPANYDNSFAFQGYDSSLTSTYSQQAAQPESVKRTLSSLGWEHGTDSLKLYTFVVPKGKEPYFELQEQWTPTFETPKRVYLDLVKGFKNSQFPCLHPGPCDRKQKAFSRTADLERHYRILHADKKELYPCDYLRCTRSREPFTRKDHYRDHLRDYHQEDIGHAKVPKDKDKRKAEQTQQDWLTNRKISSKHWRCVRCLFKNYVAQSSWECSNCKTACEESRRRTRENLARELLQSEDHSIEAIHENAQCAPASFYPICSNCNGGGYIQSYDTWVLCPSCQPGVESYYYPNTGEDSSRAW